VIDVGAEDPIAEGVACPDPQPAGKGGEEGQGSRCNDEDAGFDSLHSDFQLSVETKGALESFEGHPRLHCSLERSDQQCLLELAADERRGEPFG
jgi:hypothetical protein